MVSDYGNIWSNFFTIIAILVYIKGCDKDYKNVEASTFLGFISAMLCMFAIIILSAYFEEQKPTAIDVYRNNTTLEVTYKDSIAIDSVVVFR